MHYAGNDIMIQGIFFNSTFTFHLKHQCLYAFIESPSPEWKHTFVKKVKNM